MLEPGVTKLVGAAAVAAVAEKVTHKFRFDLLTINPFRRARLTGSSTTFVILALTVVMTSPPNCSGAGDAKLIPIGNLKIFNLYG